MKISGLLGPSIVVMQTRTGSGSAVGFPLARTYPQVIPTCAHYVDAAPADPPLGFRPVSQTPIYDQLRGERIAADVPVTGAEPQQVDHPGKHRFRTGRSGPAAALWGPQAALPPAAHARREQAQRASDPPAPGARVAASSSLSTAPSLPTPCG